MIPTPSGGFMANEVPGVRVSLRGLMEREGVNQADLMRGTGLSQVTVKKLYHCRSSRVDLETLGKLMAYFKLTSFDQLLRLEPVSR
jgi:DNA-binding Xre family transcriptional regulator